MRRPRLADVVAVVVAVGVAGGVGGGTAGCDVGSLSVTIAGSEAAVGSSSGPLEDGASVGFSSIVVALDDVTVAARAGDVAALVDEPFLVDVSSTEPRTIALVDVPAGAYERVSVVVAPAEPGLAAVNVDEAVAALMVQERFSVFAQGRIQAGGASTSFSWGFSPNTRYVDCVGDAEAPGVVVVAQRETTLDLVVRGEGLFATSLSPHATTRSAAAILAADVNDDDVIDLAELEAVDLEGVDELDVAGRTDVITLADFVSARAGALLGVGARGACVAERR
jgi:hypothetical protein